MKPRFVDIAERNEPSLGHASEQSGGVITRGQCRSSGRCDLPLIDYESKLGKYAMLAVVIAVRSRHPDAICNVGAPGKGVDGSIR